jgi:hypothetical protein
MQFLRTKSRLWQGNGFGYSGAEYAIVVDGVQIGKIDDGSITYGWRARMNDGRVILSPDGKLATLKKELRKCL